ncbi:MAG: hypothetical protein U0K14_01420 [Eggerthellaceae bacterium]|nr:hypothetical protein [Eggerthellaceae bacterium]
MQRLKKHILPYAVAILSACVLAFALCGCDSNKIPLQQEVTMETEWGPVAHYNVKTNWTTYDTLTGSDRSSSFAYYENNINPEDGFIFFMLTNPHTDKYESGSDLFLTPDTVALVKTNHSQYAHHLVVEGNWEALSQEESDGITFDRYKYSCNVTYYNSQYPWNKGSDYKEEDLEVVYAVAKSNIYDIEIAASSENLLTSFLDTLSIDWNLDPETISKLPA